MANYKKNDEYRYGADGVLMNEEDYAAVQKYKDAWNAANAAGDQAGMSAAHDAAEALRAKYAYSGGGDGSEYIKTPETKQFAYESAPTKYQGQIDTLTDQLLNRESFSYESAPAYASKYQDQIDELTAQLLNREAFSYDPTTDPSYAAYKKEYAREGQRATADTLGQYAAMTGGMPSSAAIVASQQAGDYYAAQMADKIPELQQLAYSMYQAEGDRQRANLDMLMALEQGDYAKYQNLLNQYNTDRSFAYGVYSDANSRQRADLEALMALDQNSLAQYNTDRNFAYGVDRDRVEDARYADETAYNRSTYESEMEYNRALQKAQTLAAAGDFSGYAALGYSDAEIAALKANYDAAQLLTSSSGRSSSSTGGAAGDDNETAADWDSLFTAAKQSGHPQSFISNNYKKYGFTSSSGLWSDYQDWMESQPPEDEGGLSQAAMSILESYRRINPGTKANIPQVFADKIDQALQNGDITEGDADYLLKILGY